MLKAQLALSAWLLCLAACSAPNVSGAPDAGQTEGKAGGAGTQYANNCVGPDCACREAGMNNTSCGGKCVSLQTDQLNCGACGVACATYQSCVQGVCTCPTGELWCDGRCAQVADDRQNCGACGRRCKTSELCSAGVCKPNTTSCMPACEDGQVCEKGSCVCTTGETYCDGRCVDLRFSPDHCGACGAACPANKGCTNGACTCGRGETACGNGCVDMLTDNSNCGSCGRACSTGQACSDGTCKSTWTDGCTGELAHELSLREIAVYQSVKIPVANGTQAASPTIPIVQGRDALFRVFVDLGGNFKSREVAARLSVSNDSNISRFSQRLKVTLSSTDADTGSTFMLPVPASKIGPNTKYSLELVECVAAVSGNVSQARFPSSGEAELGARKTGSLNITLIPVQTNSRVPDTSSAVLQKYREYLEAMYPVERVNFTVGQQITTDYPISWTTLVEQIRAQRKADAPPPTTYYYGLVKPTESLGDYCGKGCTAGIGYVTPPTQAATRAAVGLAFGDEVSASTMAHEIGHNHGRNHAPCATGKTKISGVDHDYPNDGGQLDSWGYDERKQAFWAPEGATDAATDIMGYCDNKWTSAYTYNALLDRIISVNGIDGITPADNPPVKAYRVLLVDDTGPHWGAPFDEPAEGFGEPDTAEILDIDGNVIAVVDVYRTTLALDETEASTILVPPPEIGWYAVRVPGAPALAFDAR